MTVTLPDPWWVWLLFVFGTGLFWAIGTTLGAALTSGLIQMEGARHHGERK